MANDTILAGTPAALSGFVTYVNSTGAEVTIDELDVRDPDGDGGKIAVGPITVPDGKSARIAVNLSLAAQTAPGSYDFEITISDTTLPAVAQVAASREIAISPDLLVVDNVPEAETTATVVVANNGNVPAYVADFGAVPLYREDAALSTLLKLAAASPLAGIPDIDPLPEPAGSITVSLPKGRVEIAPGETLAVDVDIGVPKDLDQTTRYLAALPISVRTLLLTLVPAGEAGNP